MVGQIGFIANQSSLVSGCGRFDESQEDVVAENICVGTLGLH